MRDSRRLLATGVGLGLSGTETGKYSLLFGYRQLEIELEDTDGNVKVETDLGLSGPFAGLRIRS